MGYYNSSENTKAPLSGAYEVNGLIYVSGQIHADANWNLIGETVEDRFNIVMTRIEDILSEANLTKENIFRLQLYLVDMNELPTLNAVYTEYFDRHPMPIRTAIGVESLPLGAKMEIDTIASR